MTTVPGPDERHVRLTELDALANLRTVLELCAAGQVKCSDKTRRPSGDHPHPWRIPRTR